MAGEKFNFWSKKPGGITGTEIWPIQGASGAPGDNWSLDGNDMAAFTKEYLNGILPTTIGTGGDYTNVAAAIAAGLTDSQKRNIVFVSDVTENTSFILGGSITAPIGIDMNTYRWNLGATTCTIDTVVIQNGTITGTGIMFSFASQYRNARFSRVSFNTNSSGGAISIPTRIFGGSSNSYLHMQYCNIKLGNNSTGFCDGAFEDINIDFCDFYGGGSSSSAILRATSIASITNCIFYNAFDIIYINGLFANNQNSGNDQAFSANRIETVSSAVATPNIANCKFPSTALYINTGTDTTAARVSNSRFLGYLSTSPKKDCYLSNVVFHDTNSITMGGNTSNCTFMGPIVLSNNSRSSTCTYNSTLTINTGTTGVKIYGRISVGAYTDSGTGTVDL